MVDYKSKDFIVWYKAGGGGFFVAWLLNIALNPSLLNEGLNVFPLELKKSSGKWQAFEKTPPDVALMCNMFYPDFAIKNSHKKIIENLLMDLTSKGQIVDDLLPQRTKFFLINYLLESGNISATTKFCDDVISRYSLDKFKHITDQLFDVNKSIFLIAPEKYAQQALKIKNNHTTVDTVDTEIILEGVLSKYSNLKIFKLEAIWKGHWQSEIEKSLNQSLTSEQLDACSIFIERYMEIMPKELLKICYDS